MTHRIPGDAFDAYLGMGPDRSYRAVAQHFGVTKRGILKVARRDGWQRRLREIEARARARADTKAVDDLSTVYARQLKTLRALQGRCLAALQSLPVSSPTEAGRLMIAAMQHERAILETPGATGDTIIRVVTGVPRPEPDEGAEEAFPPKVRGLGT